jgi:hypothetical protein
MTPAVLIPGVYLPNSSDALFTAQFKTIVTRLTLTNQSASSVSGVEVSVVKAGATPGDNHRPMHSTVMPVTGRALVPPELQGINLEPGDSIRAEAGTAGAVSCFAFGIIVP